MTEYDYSEAAMHAHMQKLASIDKWRLNNSNFPPANPFVPTVRDDTEFYTKKSKSKSKKSKKKGYYSADDSEDSDYGGPDRPPTPPASTPMGFGYATPFAPLGYPAQYPNMMPNSAPARYPQPPLQPPYQFINNQTGVPLVPTWDAARNVWVYQHQSVTSPTTSPVASGSGPRSHHRKSSHKHRREHSLPPPVVAPMMGQVYPAMGSGGYYPASSALYLHSGHTSPASGVYALPQQNGYVQMPVPQIQMVPQTSSCLKPSNASASSYPYTVIVDSKRDNHKSSGSSIMSKLKKKR